MLYATVDDTLEVETNSLKALVRTTAPATDHSAQHQDMAAVQSVKNTDRGLRLQLR